ncbi:MAG: 2-oxo acid dehydrogenase subunit E2 [Gammaproteobacteria bacterium]
MARREVTIPDLGDFKDVEIIEILVKAGDVVSVEQPLLVLETEKAAMEVPSPSAGTVLELKVEQGGRVSKGDLIVILDAEESASDGKDTAAAASAANDQAAAKKTEAAAKKTEKEGVATKDTPKVTPEAAPEATPARTAPADTAKRAPSLSGSLPPIDESNFAKAHASPSVRKFARELGVDLGRVKGSGQKGRVVVDDIKTFVKSIMSGAASAAPALPKVPVVDFGKFGPVEVKPLSRVQKISGPRLQAAWLNIPHVTQHDEADISDLEARRNALKAGAELAGARLTPLAFFIRACVLALKEFPAFNSSLTEDGASLVMKNYWHIGFAADTPQGLVVPVIRNVEQMNVFDIAKELGILSEKARAGKISAAEMQGGTFTVSSLGGIGGTYFTPIVNAPEVAILGIGRAQTRPVWLKNKFVPRLLVPLSLSYDHRVIDGATGVRFSTFLVDLLADVEKLVKA